ncbi:Curved DNA-binding protein [Kingella potus]|uniref:Curved DNA-binding protein n=1 Tax=Kingella potus TaxID=265175 RepID=A0A377R1N9_9NEIS|nr:DnaJ C-terminal domain-containing protein [Kingella potus]STR00945.1 Curved DNA-binding protein [Kingella potus]
MAEKNYYEILGVEKSADADTIKKAYRKLVRKYHPDVSKEPDAAERTAEINRAYETLSDKEKRAEYDEILANPYGRSPGGNPFGRGFDGAQDGSGGFRYEYRGGEEPFGAGDFHFEDLFSHFGGSPYQEQTRHSGPIKGEDQHAELAVDIYAAYVGAERTLTLNVPAIDEYGRASYQAKTLNVKIPQGITEGQQIRLGGQGLPGYNGGANGDLYLKIKFHDKPDLYVKNKKDVYQTIDVQPWDAVLGGKITVATASGRLHVSLPANSQNGKSIRLKGKGIPAKEAGDLYLNIRISVPSAQNEADRAAWAALAAHFAGRTE